MGDYKISIFEPLNQYKFLIHLRDLSRRTWGLHNLKKMSRIGEMLYQNHLLFHCWDKGITILFGKAFVRAVM